MPVGVSWSRYLSFSTAALLSMLAGSQSVHLHYKPLVDLHEYLKKELQNLPPDIQVKIIEELKSEGVLK